MSTINKIHARQIYDSRGNPTVEVDLFTDLGRFRACVPSGASTGEFEAVELRDNNPKRFHGKGVDMAVFNVNTIIGPNVIGMDVRNQRDIDMFMVQKLDGTKNQYGWCKSKLGANAILGVSLAVCRAAAAFEGIPLYQHIANLAGNKNMRLPTPAFNVINGGRHAGNSIAMQEFMIIPSGATTFREALQMASETYHELKAVIKGKYGQDAVNVGDEGGFAPNLKSHRECLELITCAIERCGYKGRINIGIDPAASEFYDSEKGKYDLNKWNTGQPAKYMSSEELLEVYCGFVRDFPIIMLEDPFDEEDYAGHAAITKRLGDKIEIVGDDIFVTNCSRIQKGIDQGACNGLLLKVNQIGTLSESLDAVKMAYGAKWGIMTSHRSGETEDTFIADLATGVSTGLIKTGSPCRSERVAKYNQLLRIEEEIQAQFAKKLFTGQNYRRFSKL